MKKMRWADLPASLPDRGKLATKPWWLCAVACLPLMVVAAVPPVAGEQIDAVVTKIMHDQQLPGVAVAVMQRGHLVYAKGYGLANVELQVPVTPATVFQSASVGKMFTATAVMLLVEDGALRLDDNVNVFFPDVPDSWGGMTIRHLLSHTSGISEDAYNEIDLRRDYSDSQLLEFFKSWPLDFAPGTGYRYSNPGYVLLGILIRKVTGRPYGDFLEARVFRPLGMTSARVNDVRAIVPGRASGYVLDDDGRLLRDEWVSPSLSATADGSLLFSVLDLAKWDAGLHAGKLLKINDQQLMWQAAPLEDGSMHPANYGFGWATSFVRGHRVVAHSGSWQGFRSYLVRYVDDGLSIAVLANLAQADPDRLAHHVAANLMPELAPYEVVSDAHPELTLRLRRVLRGYLDGRVDKGEFSTAARARWNEAQYRRNVGSIGRIDGRMTVQLVDESGGAVPASRTYRIAGTEERPPQLVRFQLTAQGKIESLSFQSDY